MRQREAKQGVSTREANLFSKSLQTNRRTEKLALKLGSPYIHGQQFGTLAHGARVREVSGIKTNAK